MISKVKNSVLTLAQKNILKEEIETREVHTWGNNQSGTLCRIIFRSEFWNHDNQKTLGNTSVSIPVIDFISYHKFLFNHRINAIGNSTTDFKVIIKFLNKHLSKIKNEPSDLVLV